MMMSLLNRISQRVAAARAQSPRIRPIPGVLPVLGILLVSLPLVACEPGGEPAEEHNEEDSNLVEVSLDAQQNGGFHTEAAGPHDIQRLIATTGVVTAAQPRVTHIRPLGRGIVQEVFVRLGDRVEKDQPLLTYDNIDLGEAVGEYLDLVGGLSRLEARRIVAETSLERAEALLEVEAIPRGELELRQAEYGQALAELESQHASLERVEERLHRFGVTEEEMDNISLEELRRHAPLSLSTLRARRTGVITQFETSQGEVIDRESQLLTIVDTSIVWVMADLYEKDLGEVKEGEHARIVVPSYPDDAFTGMIDYVSDFLDPDSRTAKVRCIVENSDRRLKLQMFATVEIPVHLTAAAVAVPVAALQQVGDETVVFLRLDSTHFERRPVRLGAQGAQWVEVLEGLAVGEVVVTEGGFYLKSAILGGSLGHQH